MLKKIILATAIELEIVAVTRIRYGLVLDEVTASHFCRLSESHDMKD